MIWLIGSKGMLGTELSLALERQGLAFTGTDRNIDITNNAALDEFAEEIRHDPNGPGLRWIINCAAYTAVDKAEDDTESCRRLNVQGAGNVAKTAARLNARLIHLSTDYVFDGNGIKEDGKLRPYRENDQTNPTGVYGLTKSDGEKAVFKENAASYIIRTAWLYGEYGNNFVHTMLRLMQEKDTIAVVNDQRGSPTWAHDLTETIIMFIKAFDNGRDIPFGIYNFTNEGDISWYDFAREIYAQSRERGIVTRDCTVQPCTSAVFPAKVKRPAYSVLDKTKIKTVLGLTIPPWDASLIKFLDTKKK
jgi:dTDP-4-dehydrorhamnose reductase